MKELWESTINTYNDYRGTGKLLALFLVSVLIIYLINSMKQADKESERINPLLFILSPATGIGYAFTLAYERYLDGNRTDSGVDDGEKIVFGRILTGFIIMLTIALSGRLVFMSGGIVSLTSLLLLPVYTGIYILLAVRLFKEKNLRWFMIAVFLVLNLWGYQSDALLPVTMLCAGLSLPAVIVHGILPLILWVAIDKYRKYTENGMSGDVPDKEEADYYEWEEEDMKNHKIINSRNLAIALIVVVILMFGSIFVMNRKINNLYQTTVNLQEQVNSLQK